MDLSPLARERLARIGQLSDAEQQKLQRDRELEGVLSSYFTGGSDAEKLWQGTKALSDTHGPGIVREAQEKIIGTLRLQTSDDDFSKRKAAILALETLKGSDRYSAIELLLGSIDALRQRYGEVIRQALDQLRGQMEDQMRGAAEQARRQGMLVDTEGTIEASIKAAPEWQEFMSRHDTSSQQTLHDYVDRLKALL